MGKLISFFVNCMRRLFLTVVWIGWLDVVDPKIPTRGPNITYGKISCRFGSNHPVRDPFQPPFLPFAITVQEGVLCRTPDVSSLLHKKTNYIPRTLFQKKKKLPRTSRRMQRVCHTRNQTSIIQYTRGALRRLLGALRMAPMRLLLCARLEILGPR